MTAPIAAPVQPCRKTTANRRLPGLAHQPEPTELYSLVVVVLHVHAAAKNGKSCLYCGDAWPCEPLRLACRLREGF